MEIEAKEWRMELKNLGVRREGLGLGLGLEMRELKMDLASERLGVGNRIIGFHIFFFSSSSGLAAAAAAGGVCLWFLTRLERAGS